MSRDLARTTSISPLRVLTVTAALAAAGAVIGGVLGALLIAVWETVTVGLQSLGDWPAYGWGGLVGASVGAVLAPLVSWTLLRRVPLGRAILETAIGTVLGSVAALLVSRFNPTWGLYGAGAGLVLAAIRLWFAARRSGPGA